MTYVPQLDDLASRVLTPRLQAELGITTGTIWPQGQYLRFRLDPGHLFERRGSVCDHLGGSYTVVIAQRYQPSQPLADAVRATVPSAAELPGALRTALAFASGREGYTPHWLDRYTVQLPRWSHTYLAPQSGAAATMTIDMAESTGAVHYLYALSGQLTSTNNAPGIGRFFSVTPDGDWSMHQGAQTMPLATVPSAATLAVIPTRRPPAPARSLARRAR
jgi:hypothetical protein